jgi:hypothetical protein
MFFELLDTDVGRGKVVLAETVVHRDHRTRNFLCRKRAGKDGEEAGEGQE